MEESQTSFIPKKTRQESGSSGMDFLTFVSIVIFLLTIASSGGLYLYNRYLNNIIAQNTVTLEKQRGAFETNLVQELSRLELRINTAKEILKNHVAPSMIFKILEETALKSVRFNDFNYALLDDGVASIKLNGETSSYAGVVLQSKNFGDNKYIKEPIFSGLNTNQEGKVVFSFESVVDSRYVSYENRVRMGDINKPELLPTIPVSPNNSNETQGSVSTTTSTTTKQFNANI